MKRNYTGFLKSIVQKFRDNSDDELLQNFAVMKYYCSYELIEDDNWEESLFLENVQVYTHTFEINKMQDPFEPVLDFIKQEFLSMEDVNIAEKLKEASVYPLIIPMFESFIETGVMERREPVILCEIEYDRHRVFDSIINLLAYITKEKKVIFTLKNFHYAQASTIDLINVIMNNNRLDNLLFVISYNEFYRIPLRLKENWDKFVQKTEQMKCVIDYDISINKLNKRSSSEFIPNLQNYDTYIYKISNMEALLAIEQANFYLELLYHKYEIEKSKLSYRRRFNLLVLYGYNSYISENTKMTHIICNKLKQYTSTEGSVMDQCYCAMLTAKVKLIDDERVEARKYVEKCIKYALETKDEKLIFDAKTLEYIVLFNNFNDIDLGEMEEDIRFNKSYIELARKYQYYNMLSYLCFFGYYKLDLLRAKLQDEKGLIGCEYSNNFKMGIKYAKITGNQEVQLKAWEKNVMIAAKVGDYNKIVYYYNNCLELLNGQVRDLDIGMVYNGLGYNAILCEHFSEAKKYFSKSIKIFCKLQDACNICETLYNLAINAIVTEEYEISIICLEHVIDMVEKLHDEKLRVCNISKAYGMLAFSYIRMGYIFEARIMTDKMKLVLRHILEPENGAKMYAFWDDDMVLYYLVEGIIYKIDNQFEKAIESFRNVEFHFNRERINQFYIYPEFAIEKYKLMIKTGKKIEAKEFLRNAIKMLRDGSHFYKADELESILNDLNFDYIKMGKIQDNIDFKKIEELSKLFGIQTGKKQIESSLIFLESWVDLLNSDNQSLEKLIENAMHTIKTNFSVDQIIYIQCKNREVKTVYCDEENPISSLQERKIVEYFEENSNKIVLCRFDSSFDKYRKFVKIFGENKVFSLMAVSIDMSEDSKNYLIAIKYEHRNFTDGLVRYTEDELKIFKTSFRQLLDAITGEEIKKKLEKSSITDGLTGLLNRQGAKSKIEEDLEDLKLVKPDKMFTVVYLDLDNFKQCNDTYGHDVGDAVLFEFGRILRTVVGEKGHIVRYGGDEFLVILPNRDSKVGVEIAQQILSIIEKNNGFSEVILKAYKGKQEINTSIKVLCSIGIADVSCRYYSDVIELIKKSDEALYHVKTTTKHNYFVWKGL